MSKSKGLREIEWGLYAGGDNKLCIYDNGHVDPVVFLKRVRSMANSSAPDDVRAALTEQDVNHIRFRSMSPSEARSWGADSGVMEAEDGRGYPVTACRFTNSISVEYALTRQGTGAAQTVMGVVGADDDTVLALLEEITCKAIVQSATVQSR